MHDGLTGSKCQKVLQVQEETLNPEMALHEINPSDVNTPSKKLVSEHSILNRHNINLLEFQKMSNRFGVFVKWPGELH